MYNVDREVLKEKYGNEEVLVVRLGDLPSLEEGLNELSDDLIESIMDKSYFIPRWESDYNREEVEIIPYPIIRTETTGLVFCVRRIKNSNEKRLLSKLSLGIGGHVNPSGGVSGKSLILSSTKRELMEELNFDSSIFNESDVSIEGLIRCFSTSVDLDHVGVLIYVTVPDKYEENITVRETDVVEGGFVPVHCLLEGEKNSLFENWSKITLNALVGVE